MAKKTKKNEAPSCACGKPEDPYEIWLENEKTKKENLSSTKKENTDKSVT